MAHADTESPKLKLAGFVDAAEGTELIAGDYATVIEKLAPHSFAFDADEVAASTNLCVWPTSRWAGWMKPTTPVTKPSSSPAWISGARPLQEHMAYEDALAVAVANREVLTKLSGE